MQQRTLSVSFCVQFDLASQAYGLHICAAMPILALMYQQGAGHDVVLVKSRKDNRYHVDRVVTHDGLHKASGVCAALPMPFDAQT